MSEIVAEAVRVLEAKIGSGFDGSAKFVMPGHGAIIVDAEGVRAGVEDEDTEVTLIADADTFRGILEGTVSPTMAFMSGKLRIEGSMSAAMRLASLLT